MTVIRAMKEFIYYWVPVSNRSGSISTTESSLCIIYTRIRIHILFTSVFIELQKLLYFCHPCAQINDFANLIALLMPPIANM